MTYKGIESAKNNSWELIITAYLQAMLLSLLVLRRHFLPLIESLNNWTGTFRIALILLWISCCRRQKLWKTDLRVVSITFCQNYGMITIRQLKRSLLSQRILWNNLKLLKEDGLWFIVKHTGKSVRCFRWQEHLVGCIVLENRKM